MMKMFKLVGSIQKNVQSAVWDNAPLTNPPSVKASSLSFHRSTTGSDRIRRISSALFVIVLVIWPHSRWLVCWPFLLGTSTWCISKMRVERWTSPETGGTVEVESNLRESPAPTPARNKKSEERRRLCCVLMLRLQRSMTVFGEYSKQLSSRQLRCE